VLAQPSREQCDGHEQPEDGDDGHCVEHREGCGYDRHRDNARAEPGDAMHKARGQERR